MAQVILQPASGVEARDHYRDTIQNSIDLRNPTCSVLMSDSEREALSELYPDGRAWVWGARESMVAQWEKIITGDHVLFYQRGVFISAHKVTYKIENLLLANYLWNSEWPYIYFLTAPIPIEIPLEEINAAATPPYNMPALQQMIVSDRGLDTFVEARTGEVLVANNDASESSNWWVCQGTTYQQERIGGYVWAPQTSKSGNTLFDHRNVSLLKKGERVIHYSEGHIRAVGVVEEDPSLKDRPTELPEDVWENKGFYAKIHYQDVDPIPLNDIPIHLRKKEKYGAFNVKGGANEGYMYRIPQELMTFVLSQISGMGGGSAPSSGGDVLWDEFVKWAGLIYESPEFDTTERNYKIEVANHLRQARTEFLANSNTWQETLLAAFRNPLNNLTHWQISTPFLNLIDSNQPLLIRALKAIWADDEIVSDLEEKLAVDRVRAFIETLQPDAGYSGNMIEVLGSYLLMAVDTLSCPIYRAEPTRKAYQLTGVKSPSRLAPPIEKYEFALKFLMIVKIQCWRRGVEIRDNLDAQSIVWWIAKNAPPTHWDQATKEAFLRYRSGDMNIEQPFEDLDKLVDSIKESGLRVDEQTIRRYHSAILSKGFVILSGISGTGKTWLAQEYARAVGGEELLVPVAPNWTTNEDLLGYQNPINNQYQHTNFSKFLIDAKKEWDRSVEYGDAATPYFLILDEMNLARVEYYFALFLSKLEVMHRGGLATIDLGAEQVELTPNLKVVGTVNIDETTQMFSDKVYDRSQLIELPVIRGQISELIGEQPYKEDLLRIWDSVRDTAPFAYRVVSEISGYWKQSTALGSSSEDALDEQILQKILPKIKGMDQRVKTSLESIRDISAEKYPLTHTKVESMLTAFIQNGITSYFA